GGSRSKAFTVARLENPDVYDAYQAWHSGNTTQQQRAVQQETNDLTTKAAPLTFEAAVNAEIRKGHNPRVAAQRVMNHYGTDSPRESFAKAADIASDWRTAAQDIVDRDGGSRLDALRKCRLERPEL